MLIPVFMLWEVDPRAAGLSVGEVHAIRDLGPSAVLLFASDDAEDRDEVAREFIAHNTASHRRRLLGMTTLLVTDDWPIFRP